MTLKASSQLQSSLQLSPAEHSSGGHSSQIRPRCHFQRLESISANLSFGRQSTEAPLVFSSGNILDGSILDPNIVHPDSLLAEVPFLQDKTFSLAIADEEEDDEDEEDEDEDDLDDEDDDLEDEEDDEDFDEDDDEPEYDDEDDDVIDDADDEDDE